MAKYNVSKSEAKRLGIKRFKIEDDKKSSSKIDDKFKKELKKQGVYDYYKNLSPDQQEFAQYNFKITRSDAKENVKLYQEALKEAEAQADPYWKSYLIIAQDEVERSVDDAIKTTESEVERNQRLIERLNENLASNKEFLSLEQQSELANLSKDFEANQEQLVEGAAEAGLTFSTKRKIAEQRLKETQTGLVESSQRQYNKQISDLTKQAETGSLEASKEIEDLQRRLGTTITGIGRAAESELGTKNLPTLPGYKALGDVSGELYERKTADIADRQQAIFDEKSRASLAY